jgi:uncharacterized protein YjbI with pentapeptide repeats
MNSIFDSQSATTELALEPGGEYTSMHISAIIAQSMAHGVYFGECQFSTVNLSSLQLPRLILKDCLLQNCGAAGLDCNSAYFEHTTFFNSRASGVQAYESKQKQVAYIDCKLDLANFGGSQLKNVRFENCLLQNADFTNVTFDKVEIIGCELEESNFSNAQIKSLDLRGSKLVGIIGTTSLKGALVTYDQLLELAPSLAQDIGLVIKDD